jgi:hypothetical protein
MDPSVNPSAAAANLGTTSWGGIGKMIGPIGTVVLLVASITFIVYGYYSMPEGSLQQNYSIGFGSVALVATVLLALSLTGVLPNFSGGFGTNTGAIVAVVIVSAIAFLIVFSPVIAGESSSTLGAGSTAAIVLAVLIVIGVMVGFLLQQAPGKILSETVRRVGLILYFFLPYSLILLGPIIDAITTKFQFVPATIVGITSIFMNWAISTFFNNGVSPVPSNIACEIPGLSIFSSNLIPQPMMASLSILAYFATYISRSTLSGTIIHPSISFTNAGNLIWPVWAVYGVVAAVYTAALMGSGCLTVKGVLPAIIAPSVYGGIFGILGFEFLAPRYDPGGAAATNSRPLIGGASSTTPTVGTCAAGSSDGEFICESFENGKLKRTTMTE